MTAFPNHPTLRRYAALVLGIGLTLSANAGAAPVEVRDDAGNLVRLAQPARRIVSLAPHVTELLFAAGAGEQVIAATDYSDWPPATARLRRVGSYQALDLERIAATQPDLVVGWASGNPSAQIDRLRGLGIPVFLSEPKRLPDIADNLKRLGILAGTRAEAEAAARDFSARLEALRTRFAGHSPVRVFYQIWSQPLMTLNGNHMVSDVITLCGGENVFARLGPLAPTVSEEAVLQAAPEAIITPSEPGVDSGRALQAWKRWTQLPAVAQGNLFGIDGNRLNRSGPRLADGAAELCQLLDTARQRRTR